MTEFSLTTFSEKGTLPQVEHALEAIAKGETAIGFMMKESKQRMELC